ncbi:MAG: ATP-binding protein [Atribacterota bacterium]
MVEMMLGTVTGLKEVTPYRFWVRMNSSVDRVLSLDEIVKIEYSWGRDAFLAYGVITEIVASWDGTISSGYQEEACFEGIYQGVPLYLGQVVVTRVLKREEDDWVTVAPSLPPPVGERVMRVTSEEVDVALGFDQLKRAKRGLPFGVLAGGEAALLDLKYILGDNGAHINVSGQSGVATKTSYATFLLWMLLYSSRSEAMVGSPFSEMLLQSRAIVFNVKGESLLFLDCWNREWQKARNSSGEENRQFQEWEEMFRIFGLEPHPFENVKVMVAPKDAVGTPNLARSRSQVSVYGWDILDIVELGLIPLLFDPEELERNPNFSLAVSVIEDLFRERYERLVEEAKKELKQPSTYNVTFEVGGLDRRSLVRVYLHAVALAHGDPEEVLQRIGLPSDCRNFVDMFHGVEDGGEGDVAQALRREKIEDRTILAISRRLRMAQKAFLGKLWRKIEVEVFGEIRRVPEPLYHIDWNRPGGVTVVDIAKLSRSGQAFVVGAILREVMCTKEEQFLEEPVFVYLDELNKYAPREGGGPLGAIFQDVAERGRSFRVILLGAEQTASQVDYRVVTQASTVVVGRQKLAELSKPEYAHLQGVLRERASALLPGEVIVDQPFLRLPLAIRFPLTPWATSEENRGEHYTKERIAVSDNPGDFLKRLLE